MNESKSDFEASKIENKSEDDSENSIKEIYRRIVFTDRPRFSSSLLSPDLGPEKQTETKKFIPAIGNGKEKSLPNQDDMFTQKVSAYWNYLALLSDSAQVLSLNILKFYSKIAEGSMQNKKLSIENFDLQKKVQSLVSEREKMKIEGVDYLKKEYSNLILNLMKKCVGIFKMRVSERKKLMIEVERFYLKQQGIT